MTNGILEYLTVFVLAAFVGIEVVSKVPSILHTPLMSGSNAIHGVILVGSMLVLGTAHTGPEEVLGFLAVVLATLNVVGGFVVTDRMLEMFKGRARPEPRKDAGQPGPGPGSGTGAEPGGAGTEPGGAA
ncbi:MAG: NAD(P) transhydrogenase subunit alpha [Acidimicrobiales bacterium]